MQILGLGNLMHQGIMHRINKNLSQNMGCDMKKRSYLTLLILSEYRSLLFFKFYPESRNPLPLPHLLLRNL